MPRNVPRVCALESSSYDLEHFVHVTQCVFSKLMQDEDGDTPLIRACRGGHVEIARALIEHRTNVDQQNNVSSVIQWNSSKADTIGTNNFDRCSKVSLAQGLVVDHAPPSIAASYDKAQLWTMKKTVLMRRLSTNSSWARI